MFYSREMKHGLEYLTSKYPNLKASIPSFTPPTVHLEGDSIKDVIQMKEGMQLRRGLSQKTTALMT